MSDGIHHVKQGRRSPIVNIGKPPAKRGKAQSISNNRRDHHGKREQ